MSRSYKDKANHFLHHKVSGFPFASKKAKHKYSKDDVPNDIKELVQILEKMVRL